MLVMLLVLWERNDSENDWSCGWSWDFSWSCSLTFCHICIFVGHRGKSDRGKASVGRDVGSEIETSEDEMDKIRSVKLVVWFGSIHVTNTDTNYLRVVHGHNLSHPNEEKDDLTAVSLVEYTVHVEKQQQTHHVRGDKRRLWLEQNTHGVPQ